MTLDGRKTPQEDIDFLEYYASRVHKEHLFMGEKAILTLRRLANIFRWSGNQKNRDQIKAIKYYKMEADGGITEAQYSYALMLYKGERGEKNLPEARKYCKMAADQGFPPAIICLNYLKGSANNTDGDLCDNDPITRE